MELEACVEQSAPSTVEKSPPPPRVANCPRSHIPHPCALGHAHCALCALGRDGSALNEVLRDAAGDGWHYLSSGVCECAVRGTAARCDTIVRWVTLDPIATSSGRGFGKGTSSTQDTAVCSACACVPRPLCFVGRAAELSVRRANRPMWSRSQPSRPRLGVTPRLRAWQPSEA